VRRNLQLHSLLDCNRKQQLMCIFEKRLSRLLFRLQLDASRLELGDRQQIIDQVAHALR
jgi:hypothetical protein